MHPERQEGDVTYSEYRHLHGLADIARVTALTITRVNQVRPMPLHQRNVIFFKHNNDVVGTMAWHFSTTNLNRVELSSNLLVIGLLNYDIV